MYSFLAPKKLGKSMIQLNVIKNPKEINHESSKKILIESFIEEFKKYLKPAEVSDELTCWYDKDKSSSQDKSAEQFYADYFVSEFAHFNEGKLLKNASRDSNDKLEFWIEAKINNQLVGWATFEREKKDPKALYMNLLVVDPKEQGKGIGGALVKSLMLLGYESEPTAINVLLRKKNKGGHAFYSKLGFKANSDYVREDNFVAMDLLTPITWFHPTLEPDHQRVKLNCC